MTVIVCSDAYYFVELHTIDRKVVVDRNVSTCLDPTNVNTSALQPMFSVTVRHVNTRSLTVQLQHRETGNTAMCDRLGKMLYTWFPAGSGSGSGCDFYKPCSKNWECTENQICEYRCSCAGNGVCNVTVRNIHPKDTDWSICDIRV